MADPAMDTASQTSDNEDLGMFDKVRATLQLQNLPALALQLRNKETVATADATSSSAHNCHVVSEPLFGSHHILFKLEFNDLVRWMLKVPANGYPGAFDGMSARALKTEALTMRLAKRDTTIPVPEVYCFDDTLDNELCCPFILMEYVYGRPLYEVWFDRDADPEKLEQRRCHALEGIARAMMKLNKFVFPRGGALLFDSSDGSPCGIGPQRTVDVQAMLHCLSEDDEFDGSSIFCTVGPFDNAKSWFVCMLDRREPPPDEFGAGVYKLLRRFIDLLFPEAGEGTEFVLSHPDLAIQNVIVSEDGSLLGLIDWDGVGTVPRCLGNEAYPSWLTRDWDGAKYRYDENAAPGPDCPNNNENSPAELDHYREIYRKIIDDISHYSPSARRITSNSLLLDNLYIAAVDPVCTHLIVERIFKEIKARTGPIQPSGATKDGDKNNNNDGNDSGEDEEEDDEEDDDEGDDDDDDFYPYEVFTQFQTGDISEQNLQRLIHGFQALLL